MTAVLFAIIALMMSTLAPASFADESQSGQPSEVNSQEATTSGGDQTPATTPQKSAKTTPSQARAADHQYLLVEKTVDGVDRKELSAGQSFTYQIAIRCQEENCVNASMTDALPAQLQGFRITGLAVTPPAVNAVASWSEAGAPVDQPATVGANTALVVGFSQPFGDSSGIVAGTTAHINLTLQVPNDFSPNDPRNNQTITNTVNSAADNSKPDSDSADVVVKVEEDVDAAIQKDWAPSSASFDPGATSTITLQSRNASNVNVDTLTVQEPQASATPDGASTLDANNPFRITDFTGFGNMSMPVGADKVQVDAYVQGGDGTWTWVTGTPADSFTLPSTVSADKVGGLRFTYTGSMAPGAEDRAELKLTQRSTERNTGEDLSKVTSTIDNVAQAQTSKGKTSSPVKTDDASYTVTPASVGTSVDKSLDPNRIPAGNTTTGTIKATNTQSPVKTLTISDKDGFFSDTTTFGGFTKPVNYPENATSGTVVYRLLGGGTQEVSFDSGQIPAAPTGKIAGFDVVFSSETNSIITNGQTKVQFTVATSSNVDFGDATQQNFTNTATSTVEAANGQTGTDTDDAPLTIVKPALNVTLDKTLKPSDNVRPGQSVVADLKSTTNATSDYVKPTSIVVEDSWGDAHPENGFWNAFNLASIQPTQVPEDTTLKVEVQKEDGNWIVLDTRASQDQAGIYQLNADDLSAKLGGVDASTLTGVRFTFERPATNPFPQNTTVRPYVSYTARGLTRTGNPTDVVDGQDGDQQSSTKYTNAAVTTGTGTTNDGTPVTGTDNDQDTTGIIVHPSDGGTGPDVDIDKAWDRDSVSAQSSDQALTHLNWRVGTGFSEVVISDPAGNEGSPENTVFDAFDLMAIQGIQASNTPYTNGWFLKYDTVQKIQFYADGSWHDGQVPPNGFQEADGSFKQYDLASGSSAEVTGLRIVLVPNDQARADALAKGTDPYAPAPGTGVVTSGNDRTFDLVWRLRDKTRSDGSFVTGSSQLNVPDNTGVVDNTVAIDGMTADGTTAHDEGDDTINIVDHTPLVSVDKTARTDTTIVPAPGTVSPADYPTNQYTLKANNGAVSRASYVRVTDPVPCVDTGLAACQTDGSPEGALANPFANSPEVKAGTLDTDPGTPNPFNRQDITKVTIQASKGEQVDLDASKVWLLHFTPGAPGSATGTYSFTESTAAAVNALSAADLADVVGISVTFQGTDPATNGGSITQDNDLTITLDTRVRATLRTTGADFVPSTDDLKVSKNRVFAQSYDPVLQTDPKADSAKTGDVADATVNFNSGTLDVNPGKTITPGSITVVDAKAPQTVTLKADQGTSSVSPVKVTLTDKPDGEKGSTNFWTNFDFTGIQKVTPPAGSDQVAVSVWGPFGEGGAMTWVDGAAQSTAGDIAAPVEAARYGDVQGLKFTFTRADGAIFSTSTPNWKAEVVYGAVMRDTVRGGTAEVTFPGQATNLMTAQSEGKLSTSDEKPATADVKWNNGTARLAIDKLANDGIRGVQVGDLIPWDITIRNTGTGYLDLTQVVDTLPPALRFTGAGGAADPTHPVQFTPGTLPGGGAGTLTTTPVVDANDPGKLVFTWPQGQNRLQPSETAVIRVWLEVQPGPTSGEKITNAVSVFTEQKLDGVSDARPDNAAGPVERDGDNGAKTTDHVSPTSGENLFVVKGVKGSLAGAVNVLAPSQGCTPNLIGYDGQAYFRTPCAANSTVNGVDDWVLHVVNAGTTDITKAQFFDQLPVPGDKFLVASDADRGSRYRPQILDDLKVVGAPEGTTTKIEVTSDAGACVGTWAELGKFPAPDAQACSRNTWAEAGASTDWSRVTGLRVTLDFTTTTAKALKPGQGADVTYSSRNEPQTAADASGASTNVPATDQFGWNQFGMLYTGASGPRTLAPNKVGVHLRTGSVQVTKAVVGDAASYAPAEFTATVSCTIPAKDGQTSVPLTFGADRSTTKQVTLTRGDDGTYAPQRIAGIPVGAECTVSEDGDPGHFGETTRDPGQDVTLQVSSPDTYAQGDSDAGDPTSAVPEAQIAALENSYAWSGLSVTKKVDTQADKGSFGPFAFDVSCTTSDNRTVSFGDADKASFTLEDGQTWNAPANTIPARSTCTITETDNAKADSTVFTGEGVTPRGDGSATVDVGTDPVKIVSTLVTNHYDAGTFTVSKKVDGNGADTYGSGPFTFHSVCSYNGQSLLDETYQLNRDSSRTFGTFPAGTECTTTETKTSGATGSRMDPEDGKVTIARQATQEVSSVTTTATNTFDTGDLRILKKVDGAGAEKFGVGPFTAQATCTYQKDGETTPVALANDGKVVLSQANGYSATLTGILKGAECTVEETDPAGADTSTISPREGRVTVGGSQDQPVEVTLTNTFEAGYVTVEKKVEGEGAEVFGTGPFTFESVCTWPKGTGTGGQGGSESTTFTLEPSGDPSTLTKQLGLYPVGTQCTITETDSAAATTSGLDPEDGVVTVQSGRDPQKPSDVTLTATNTFDVASLDIVKKVDGAGAEDFGVGPFTAQVACSFQKSGKTVDVALPDDGVVTLSEDNGYRATIDGILKGSTCTVEETDRAGADTSVITGDGVTVDGHGVATTVVGGPDQDSASVTITNTFKAGYVTVTKSVEGEGAGQYGRGEFSFSSQCTFPEGSGAGGKGGSDSQEFTLRGGESKQLGLYPVGTECEIVENTTGGATSSVLSPVDGKVTVADSEDPEVASDVSVTATNTFDIGAVKIIKKRIGIGVKEFGDGPFQAQVACTYQKDGETTDVVLPDNGKVSLSKSNGYTATVTGIIAGAECTVTETKDGGADRTSMSPADGRVTVGNAAAGDSPVEVTITNEFNTPPGHLPKTGAAFGYLSLAFLALLLGGGFVALRSHDRRTRSALHVRR